MLKQPDLGKKIAKRRTANRLTQTELAELCNISLRTIQRIESGDVTPRAYTTKTIFAALGIEKTEHHFFNRNKNTMVKIGIIVTLISTCSYLLVNVNEKEPEALKGWYKAGSNPTNYIMGLDKSIAYTGSSCGFLETIDTEQDGFGTAMQSCSPSPYLGKKIRMIAYIKSENVGSWAGIWLRADPSEGKKSLAFKNTNDTPIEGTSDWVKREIELSIPTATNRLAYGFLLVGNGKIWFDDLQFEIIGPAENLTKDELKPPRNTNFEE